ncbi:sut (nucleomorph) [Hemiselmis andersenii]|uniref:Sut n=2 Tax=Hemiselmis andersenii TaxID=464988 RepID=A9BKH2_HEMAN|nr:sut [Hemiselmis andersenii]ABW98005.1 sut [Hemiselmis andersenii]|mmetsp:Transcript_1174/g.2793  ORF Transcript_1174/g.2793 Transcript_1174/m.2793 type:complete len:957 (+) Transcript_1174:50-2920(+)
MTSEKCSNLVDLEENNQNPFLPKKKNDPSKLFMKYKINYGYVENLVKFVWTTMVNIKSTFRIRKNFLIFCKKVLIFQQKELEISIKNLQNIKNFYLSKEKEVSEFFSVSDQEEIKITKITKNSKRKKENLNYSNKVLISLYKKFHSQISELIFKIIFIRQYYVKILNSYMDNISRLLIFVSFFPREENKLTEATPNNFSTHKLFRKVKEGKIKNDTQKLVDEKEKFVKSTTRFNFEPKLLNFGTVYQKNNWNNLETSPIQFKTFHIMERLEHFRLKLSEIIIENEKNSKDVRIDQILKKIKKIYYDCVGDGWKNLLKNLNKEDSFSNYETPNFSNPSLKETFSQTSNDNKKKSKEITGKENPEKKRKYKNKNLTYSLTWALYNYLPILTWFPQYNWRKYLKDDFIAGVTVGVLLIAQGMAYAKLAGLSPEYGLYSSGLPLLIYPIFGTSRHLGFGPVALISLLVSQITMSTNKAGYDYSQSEKTSFALLIAFCVGLTQIFMGLIKIGFIINFISKPVIQGFTNAAAFVIILSQLQHVLGYNVNKSHYPILTLYNYVTNIKKFRWQPFLFGTINTFFILFVKYVNKKFKLELPGPIICVFLSISLTQIFKLNRFGISIQNKIPKGFPSIKGPVFNELTKVAPTVLTISFINFLETMAIATKVADKHGYKIVPDQELIGSGMTNFIGSFVGGFPMAGSFSRTAVLDSAGGKTHVAGIITGIVIILTYLFFTPLFTYLPNVTLASIILTSVINLIEAKEAQYLFKVRRLDFFAFMISLISTFVFGVEWGIAMAVGVSLVFVLWFSIKPNISVLGRIPNTVVYRDIDLYSGCIKTPGGILLKMDAPLFFVNANVLRKKIYQKEEEYKEINPVPLFFVLLDCRGMTDIDSTGLGVLSEIAKKYIKQGVFFGLANVNDQVTKLMKVSNLDEIIKPTHIFSRVHDAVEAAISWKTKWTKKEFF